MGKDQLIRCCIERVLILYTLLCNNSIVAHIGQLIRQSAKSPISGNVACFRYTFGIDVDDNVGPTQERKID